MAIKLLAPAGFTGIVQGVSGTNYTIAADGSISGSGSLYVAGGAQLSSSTHSSGRVTKE